MGPRLQSTEHVWLILLCTNVCHPLTCPVPERWRVGPVAQKPHLCHRITTVPKSFNRRHRTNVNHDFLFKPPMSSQDINPKMYSQ
jgi:hypothetical protein